MNLGKLYLYFFQVYKEKMKTFSFIKKGPECYKESLFITDVSLFFIESV